MMYIIPIYNQDMGKMLKTVKQHKIGQMVVEWCFIDLNTMHVPL
jgi:hypothetical protein